MASNSPGLSLDEPRQRRSGAGLGVGDEAGRVLSYQALQDGLLGTSAFVVDRWRVAGASVRLR
jgi:hypothetical protein